MLAKLKAIPAFFISLPATVIYKAENEELRQCCNFSSEIAKNRENIRNKNMLPWKQTIRALCACYMTYCLWMGVSVLPKHFFMVEESTWLAIANVMGIMGTYVCIANWFPDAVNLWAWVHTFNSLLVFTNFWYCALYWNLFKHTWPQKVYHHFYLEYLAAQEANTLN